MRKLLLLIFPLVLFVSEFFAQDCSVTAAVDIPFCDGNSGSAIATPGSEGQPPFTYLWNTSPAQTTQTATGLGATTYQVTVTDSEGCVSVASVTLSIHNTPGFNPPGYIVVCEEFTFPAITGVYLTGNEAYYSGPNGSGTTYSEGDVLTVIGDYEFYIYDGIPGCSSEIMFDVTITERLVPYFNPIGPFCVGDPVPDLPLSSVNETFGSWDPAFIDNSTPGSTVHTYTPGSGQCATNQTLVVVINPLEIPLFTQIPPFCENTTSPTLPIVSDNGITGSWSPAVVSNTAVGSTTYTFTPNPGQCADSQTMDIVVDPEPTISNSVIFCEGGATQVLIGTPIGGTWSSSDNSVVTINGAGEMTSGGAGTATITYSVSGCSQITTTIVVSPILPPTFTQIADVCQNATAPALPGTSNNGITGTWSPATIDNSAPGSATHTFTPDAGQCATPQTMVVTVIPEVVPVFTPVPSFCQNTASPSLPNPSDNGISGTWSPAVDNSTVGSTTYTFTPAAGECASTQTMDLVVLPEPTITNPTAMCVIGSTQTLNGSPAGGTWSSSDPSVVTIDGSGVVTVISNGSTTISYTVNGCVQTTTIIISPLITPLFTQIGDLCENATTATLPGTSNNGITGTWSPATVDNTTVGSTTYTFTPDPGECGTMQTMTINVVGIVVPIFTPIPAFCQNSASPTLPNPSDNGIFGTWSPAVDNTTVGSTTYTFTPAAGECATTQTMELIVHPEPSISTPVAMCEGGEIQNLVGSPAGGTWSSSDNTVVTVDASGVVTSVGPGSATITYSINGCDQTILLIVSPILTPDFTQIPGICQYTTAPTLPGTSNNGVTGTWSPATIDNSTPGSTTHTFTPGPGQCATPQTMVITVIPEVEPVFTQIAPLCENSTAPALPGTSDNGISGTWNSTVDNGTVGSTTYIFTPAAGECASTQTMDIIVHPEPTISAPTETCVIGSTQILTGSPAGGTWSSSDNTVVSVDASGEITSVGVGSATITYSINGCDQTATLVVGPILVPDFTQVPDFCQFTTVAPLPNTSNNGISGTWSPATIDNTTTGSTTYTFTPAPGECATPQTMVITVDPTPVFTVAFSNPTFCLLADGTITISGLENNTSFGITYSVDGTPVGPISMTSNGSGEIIITGLGVGSYTDFMVDLNACSATDNSVITLIDLFSPSVDAGLDLVVCSGTTVTLSGGNPDGATISWDNGVTDGVGFVPSIGTTTYTITADLAGCITTDEMTIMVVPPITDVTCPADLTASCAISEQPAYADFNAFLAAGGSTAIAAGGEVDVSSFTLLSEVSDGNNCPEVVTRTYQIADTCGNVVSCSQTITINDLISPTASNPVAVTVECIDDVPVVDITVVTDAADNCTVNPTVAFVSESSDGNACNGEVITRIYSITDDCGNSTDVTHTIAIDSYTPSFTVSSTDPTTCGGSDGTITLSGLDPFTDYAMSYDGGATTLITTNAAGEYVITGLSAGSYTNYTVSDVDCQACSSTQNVTMTLTDPNPPAINAGLDQEVCAGETATINAINPDGATISWDNGVTDGVGFIPPVGTTTYTVTAVLAGCTNSDYMTIIVSPSITDIICPGGLNATCDISEQPAYANFNAFIAAGGSASIPANGAIDSLSFTLLSEVSDGNSCPEVVTRTYQIADTCGVTVTCTQTIIIHDLVDPTGTAPAALTVQCIGDVPAADIALITDAADNCTATPTVIHVGDVSDGNTCPELITRTYTIADDCGNSINVTQVITIQDDIDPTGTAPANLAFQCIGDVPAPDVTLITDAADNCTATPTVSHVSDVSDGNTCPEILSRTYRIADACGNSIDVVQTITINDDTNPTASNPVALIVECLSDVPATDPSVVTDAADNCTVSPTVVFVSESSDGNTCNAEVITRVYSVSDDCGNSINVTHTITIDSYTPTFTVSSTDPTTCGGTDGTITLSGLDPSTVYGMSYNGGGATIITTNAAGEYVITGLSAGSYIGFTVSDGNCSACDATEGVTMNLVDPNAPPIDAGIDQAFCEGTTTTLNAINPDGANISWNNGVTDGVGFVPAVGTTNYTVTAELNNCYSSDVVTIIVHPLPTVFAGNNVEVCEGSTVVLSGSGANTYVWDNGVTNGSAFTPQVGTTTYTVTGTSIHGCLGTGQVAVTVHPTPVVLFEADTTQGCIPLEVNLTSLSPGISNKCKFTINGATEIIGCDVNYTFTSSGCYDVTLEVESVHGCVSDSTAYGYICIDDFPIADFTVNPGELSSFVDEANFTNGSMGAETYEWSFGDGANSNATHPSHVYSVGDKDSYVIQLIAYSEFGCSDTAYSVLPFHEELVYYIPNSFTPDGDKFNQTFSPVFTSGFNPQNYNLLIFNRWGEVIFESNNAQVGWDGTYGIESTKIVPDGVYVWKIEFKKKRDDEHIKLVGHVTLIR